MIKTSLRYFNQVARDGSMRQAADNLHVAASAVNRQILKLEEELGIPLFERLPRGVRPTAAGEILLSFIRRWHQEETRLLHQLDDLVYGARGTVRIAASEAMADVLLPQAMAALRDKFPRVEVTIVTGDSFHILRELMSHEADLGLAFNVSQTKGLRTIATAACPWGVAVPPGHPLAELKSLCLADCAPYPIIIPRESWFEQSPMKRLIEHSSQTLNIVARGDRLTVLKALARSGVGIAFITGLEAEREVRAGELVFIPLTEARVPPSRLSLLTPPGNVPVFAAVFAEHLREQLLNWP